MNTQFSDFAFSHDKFPRSLCGYDVIDYIGEGAGSVIYVVSDPKTQQLYALKHVVRKDDRDIRFVEQLENEYEVARQFSQGGLRRAIELKINRTMLRKVVEAVLVLELFDGIPLENRPPTSMLETVDVFTKAAHALETLHQLGYIHCDIKPNNILVGPNGDVKIIDFGQACKAGTIKERIQGTPDYIAPEQVRREPVSIRTDIFCLGATMYWTLCGKKIPTLFTLKKSENSFLVDNKIATPREFNSKVPENISNLVMDCVRTAPSKRPVNMGEVAGRLEIMHHGLAAQQCKAASNATAGTL